MLVTIEGIDGAGKSTVVDALRERYPDATYTREPTDSWYGEAVDRSVADPDADPLAELFLYTADHADHLSRVVRPALAAGDLVVSDRYSDSRYAYQGVSIADRVAEPVAYVRRLHEPFTRPPDLTVYLDLPPEVGAERAGATNKFERAGFLADVREAYEGLIAAEPGRFVRVDAEQSPAAVATEAAAAIEGALEEG
jgi:dTMP kinase